MGALTQTDVVSNWLATVDDARTGLIEAAKGGNKIATAFAMAEARATLIESLADPQIRARLLRLTDSKIGMVELANNPTEDDRVRVCAIAILSGFCPGEDQFAVFGGKGGGKLYIKEAGFRTLFSHLGIVPSVDTGHPLFESLGNSGKKVWRVTGKASCTYHGVSYSVDFSGASALGLPGYDSDNVAGIAAKARRRMLQALWQTVSPILTQDQTTEDADVLEPVEPPRIETTKPTDIPDPPIRVTQELAFDQSYQAAQRRIKDEAQLGTFNAYWKAIETATTKDELRLLYSDVGGQVKSLGKNNVDELQRFGKWRAEGMAE